MDKSVSSFVERYQLLYEKDPDSKVFAPLAEAYRRMGLVDEAIDMAERGVKKHPHFASGRVALGKCLVQKSQFDKAVEQLKVAVELSPENLLAHQLLAECFARLKKPAEALNAYKMVLFLNPTDARVAQIVKKIESDLYVAAEAEIDEDFAMERIGEVKDAKQGPPLAEKFPLAANKEDARTRELERELALLDTRFERGDWAAATEQLRDLTLKYPDHPELVRRKQYMEELSQNSFHLDDFITPYKTDLNKPKIEKLKALLDRIENRRKA